MICSKQAVDVVLRLVEVHLQLLEDHHPLPLDVVRLRRELATMSNSTRCELELVGRHARPVDGDLLVRRGVHHPAHALDGLGDVLGARPARRALKKRCSTKWRRRRYGRPRTANRRTASGRR